MRYERRWGGEHCLSLGGHHRAGGDGHLALFAIYDLRPIAYHSSMPTEVAGSTRFHHGSP